jgi:thiol-disulfide isomerase/thioredoxin
MPVKPQFQISLIIGAMALAAILSYVILNDGAAPVVKNMKTVPTAQQQPQVLPETIFFDRTDSPMTLADYKGSVVLVNLWATWCPPCVAELPSLDRLQGKLGEKKFSVVAISMDRSSAEEIRAFLRDKKIEQLDFFWDKYREIASKWRFKGIPTSFLIDRDGNVVETFDGERTWDEGPLFEKITAMLK